MPIICLSGIPMLSTTDTQEDCPKSTVHFHCYGSPPLRGGVDRRRPSRGSGHGHPAGFSPGASRAASRPRKAQDRAKSSNQRCSCEKDCTIIAAASAFIRSASMIAAAVRWKSWSRNSGGGTGQPSSAQIASRRWRLPTLASESQSPSVLSNGSSTLASTARAMVRPEICSKAKTSHWLSRCPRQRRLLLRNGEKEFGPWPENFSNLGRQILGFFPGTRGRHGRVAGAPVFFRLGKQALPVRQQACGHEDLQHRTTIRETPDHACGNNSRNRWAAGPEADHGS